MPDENDVILIEKEIEEIDKKSQALFKKMEPFRKQSDALYEKRKQLLESRTQIWLETRKDDWNWILEEDGSVSGDRYKFRNKKIESLGLMNSGYNPEISQVAIKIALTNGDENSYNETIAGLTFILPFIKPWKGYKRISIFEHSLSYSGIYSLEISDTEIRLAFCRHHRESVLKTFGTLAEAIKHIQENVWYRKIVNGKEVYSDHSEDEY